ncbi:tryptophan synthase subunit alpha [Gammaproteobacteria bacterium AB-CW1]|uniref:Tryptophan synthase alpha chain n=1 Tax=Natronospira elongata TaxID=3110268 RepID=A0AAP6JED3_9GAMM|nr:tryptophan synthase subunit alpha [Gammaproteobacteria bacterium AB-CW1]
MSRIEARFKTLSAANRAALIPYIMTGDPSPDETVAVMHGLVAGGADMIELGMPFSDPVADGSIIQAAGERALAAGQRLKHSLAAVRAFRETDQDTPVIFMGYLNPVEIMGTEAFVQSAAEAGVDGLLLVDSPPEESAELAPAVREAGMDMIFLVAPTTSEVRRRRIAELGSGFVYYVSLKGVTGAGGLDVDAVAESLAGLRQHTQLPLGVGFGIRDADSAAAVGRVADAVIVGSALVEHLHAAAGQGEEPARAARQFIEPLREALDGARSGGNAKDVALS